MKNLALFAVFTAFLFSFSVNAQDNFKQGGNEPSYQYYSNSHDGNTNNPMTTTTQPTVTQFSSEKQALLNQLRQARLNNDLVSARQLQSRLDEGTNSALIPNVNDPEKTGMLITETPPQQKRPPFQYEGDYLVSTVQSGADWSVATATSHRSSTIFAAVTEYVNGGGDMLRVYASYNGGATWVLKTTYNGFAATVDYRGGELDIEPVISGSDTLVYCAAGYTFSNHALCQILVANISTGANTTTFWNFGGWADASMNTYNPRITSDNTNYTAATYVYLMVAIDSASGSRFTTRCGVYLTPFTSPYNITYRMSNAPNGFWWQSNGQPSAYLHHDICYFSSAGDRIYTIYNHSNAGTNQSLYISWSNDYGVTVTAGQTFVLAETANVQSAICAANGGSSTSVLLGYRRLFSGADWDYRVQHSATSGTSGSFTASYIEFTTDTTMLISAQAIDLGGGRYVTGAARMVNHYYRSFNNNTMGTEQRTNNQAGANNFGGCKAGYWASSNSDSCVVVWSATNGANAYCSRLICSTVGIQGNGNEVPQIYSLEQNYPNPFNPVTNIKFSIPNAGVVKLVVYDIMGREVSTIVNQHLNAGQYTADFDAAGLASGIYFYTITAGDFTSTKKMMLVK